MRDLECEIWLTLRRRVLGIHPFVKLTYAVARGRKQTGGSQAAGLHGTNCGRVSGISAFASINGQRRYLLKIRTLAYFGAGEAASCWKRGSFRSGSNIGSSRSSAGVSGPAKKPAYGIESSF